jgi:signal transduction histidine kinase
MGVRYALDLRRVPFPGGDVLFSHSTYRGGPGAWLEIASVVLLLGLVTEASVRAWRTARKRSALTVGGGLFFFLSCTRGYAMLVEGGVIVSPFFFVFPVLAILVTMGRELSLDVVLAAQLSGELRESEKRIDLATRAVHLGLWEWRRDGDRLWLSEIAGKLIGTTGKAGLSGRGCVRRMHPDDRSRLLRGVGKAMANGEEFSLEIRMGSPAAGPERWIAVHGSPDADAEGGDRRLRGTVLEVTDTRRVQARLEELRREIAHVTRVSTMGELTASLAHELNQPLAAILSNAEAASRFLNAPHPDLREIRVILQDIAREGQHAGEVIHGLRRLIQKKERVEVEAVDLNAVVREAERLMAGEIANREVRLDLDLAAALPPVWAGRVEIQQVLLNLMVNALDAVSELPRGGRVLRIRTGRGENTAWIKVADTGPGITEKNLLQVFQPFFSTKAQGLGMGLAISRSLVEAHQGKLQAANLPGGGAVFTVEFPCGQR